MAVVITPHFKSILLPLVKVTAVTLFIVNATETSVHLIAPIICAICIFYTTIGGLKAVVWTDTMQMAIMAAFTMIVFILGIRSVGGIANIIDTSSKGHRLDIFDFNIDPTIRDGICALIIGTTASNLSVMSVSQSTVQRYLAVPTVLDAKKVTAIFAFGVAVVKLTSVLTGLTIYTKYAKCDPISTGVVTHSDQILPYYIMDVAGHISGLTGLFIAGLFSASLSTLSANLNTLSATIYEDFISPFMATTVSETQTSRILKLITIIVGIICTLLIVLIEKMGSLLPLANSFTAITGGPLVGLFSLGMLIPTATAKGALCGAISGSAFLTWVVIGNQWYTQQPYYIDPVKPFSTTGCSYPVNVTAPDTSGVGYSPFYLYQVTFWCYGFMGISVTMIIGIITSWITKRDFKPVHHDLLCPLVSKMLKYGQKSSGYKVGSIDEQKALRLVDTKL